MHAQHSRQKKKKKEERRNNFLNLFSIVQTCNRKFHSVHSYEYTRVYSTGCLACQTLKKKQPPPGQHTMKQTFLVETVTLLVIACVFAPTVSSSQWSWDFNSPVPTFNYSASMSFNISIYAPLDLAITIDKNLLNPIIVFTGVSYIPDVVIPARSAQDTDFSIIIPAFSRFSPYDPTFPESIIFGLVDMANTTVLNATLFNYYPTFGVIPANLTFGENSTILDVTTSAVPNLNLSFSFSEAENASSDSIFQMDGLYVASGDMIMATFSISVQSAEHVASAGRPFALTVSTSATDIIKSNSSGNVFIATHTEDHLRSIYM